MTSYRRSRRATLISFIGVPFLMCPDFSGALLSARYFVQGGTIDVCLELIVALVVTHIFTVHLRLVLHSNGIYIHVLL